MELSENISGRVQSLRASVIQAENGHLIDFAVLKYTVAPEFWRLLAYSMFWLMCIFAIILTKTLVAPNLAKGPEDSSTCGPFNRHLPGDDVFLGQGFDMSTQSHLKLMFGYNNICSNWDYSPSRELTAMFYPLFEYPLLLYICLDFLATAIANKRGDIEPWFWRLTKVITPICLFLCAQFRMIFVCLAYENVAQHTAGFLGLQFALVLVSLHNAAFIWSSNETYKRFGGAQNGLRNTRIVIVAYIISNLAISIVKISGTFYVVLNGRVQSWTMKPVGNVVAAQIVDWIWMIFNAVIPVGISYIRWKNEAPLEIAVSQKALYVTVNGNEDEDDFDVNVAEN